MDKILKIIQILTGVGVIGAFSFLFKFYRHVKSTYATKFEILEQENSLKEIGFKNQVEALRQIHKIEIEKRELENRKLKDWNERLSHLLDKRMVDISIAVKYYLAYDLKDIKPKEKKMLSNHIDELEARVSCMESLQEALPLLVQIFLKLRNEDKAIFYQKMLVDNFPNNITFWKDLSHIYHVFGKYKEAIEASNEVLKIDGNHHQALYEIGVCNQMLASSNPKGSSEQIYYDKIAIEYYSKCLEIEPEYLTAEIMMGSVFSRLGDIKKTSAIATEIENKFKQGELVHRELYAYGCLLVAINEPSKAIEALKLAISQADSKNKVLLVNNIMTDPDLAPIKKDEEFKDFFRYVSKINREHIA